MNRPLKNDPSNMLFQLGQIVATPGALAAAEKAGVDLGLLLFRHVSGDWGSVCVEDKMLNDESVTQGNRILSAYPLDSSKPSEGFGENTLWVITEADRCVTTFLLPEEY